MSEAAAKPDPRRSLIDAAIAALDALRPAEACEAVGKCEWWDEIAEEAVDAAIDNGQVIEVGDEDAPPMARDVARLAELIHAGERSEALDLLREIYPAAPLARTVETVALGRFSESIRPFGAKRP